MLLQDSVVNLERKMVKQSVALDSLAMHKSDNTDSIIDTSTQQKGNLLPVALQLKLSKELH